MYFTNKVYFLLNTLSLTIFYGELQKSLTGGKLAAETWQRTFTVLLWQCFDVKNQNGNVLVKAMRSVMQATL